MVGTPDGMGADRYRERQNMKEARHTPTPSHDIVAVDESGDELYVTESAFSEEAAERTLEKLSVRSAPPEVNAFEIRERD